jgi:hypothetical protein
MLMILISELPFAGLVIDVASGVVAILTGLTALTAGLAHYLAVLAGRHQRKVDVQTGNGFFVGMAIGAGLLLLDFLSEIQFIP